MTFLNKEYFLLLLLLIPYFIWYYKTRKFGESASRISDTSAYTGKLFSIRQRLVNLPNLLRILAFCMLVIVLARPQIPFSWNKKMVEGIDVVLALDVSTSMLAKDINPNRIEAAKHVAKEFVAGRPNDNIGLVIFAGEAFTQCPLTTDHKILTNMLNATKTDIAARGIIEDGTAIGMGLMNAISRLENSKAKSKVVILLTDGSNNSGDISPLTAAEIAKTLGIRVYTIGIGTNDVANYPMSIGGIVQDVKITVEIDEAALQSIASATGGKYYRATNVSELKQIYSAIDKLEKTKIEKLQLHKYIEFYATFAIFAFILISLVIILELTLFRRIP